jgi:hypothetical protein
MRERDFPPYYMTGLTSNDTKVGDNICNRFISVRASIIIKYEATDNIILLYMLTRGFRDLK